MTGNSTRGARALHLLNRCSLGIGAVTVFSGAAQAAAPGAVLRLVGADRSPTSRQLFATVGMFMVIVGGALSQAAAGERGLRLVLFWATLQKLGAVAAVAAGVRHGVFSRRALAVAAFDLASAGALAAHLAASALVGRRGEERPR